MFSVKKILTCCAVFAVAVVAVDQASKSAQVKKLLKTVSPAVNETYESWRTRMLDLGAGLLKLTA